MKKTMLSTLIGLAISATSMAADNIKTVCEHGNQTRIIEVVYTGEGAVPCEVRYSKEEGTQTLWNANNAEGYCEEKATAFVEKQKGWGWNCELAQTQVEESLDENAVQAETTTEEVIEENPVQTEPEQVSTEETETQPVANAE